MATRAQAQIACTHHDMWSFQEQTGNLERGLWMLNHGPCPQTFSLHVPLRFSFAAKGGLRNVSLDLLDLPLLAEQLWLAGSARSCKTKNRGAERCRAVQSGAERCRVVQVFAQLIFDDFWPHRWPRWPNTCPCLENLDFLILRLHYVVFHSISSGLARPWIRFGIFRHFVSILHRQCGSMVLGGLLSTESLLVYGT